jgi:hypothetical protein
MNDCVVRQTQHRMTQPSRPGRPFPTARIRPTYYRHALGPAVLEVDQHPLRQIFDGALNSEHKSVATAFFSSLKWSITHSVQARCGGALPGSPLEAALQSSEAK